MKSEKKHLPVIGVGPVIVIPQVIITAAAIVLSEAGKIYSLRLAELNIPFSVTGALLILMGICMWFSANFKAKIGKSIKENRLVTTGIYAVVRNPIYSAFLIVCTGAILIEASFVLFPLPIIYYAYMTVLLINTEEKRLSELYGDEYEEYCQKVNRCIPRFSKKK